MTNPMSVSGSVHHLRVPAELVLALLLAGGTAGAIEYAQGPAEFETFRAASDAAPPTVPCSHLRTLTDTTRSIESAAVIPARGGVPAACVVVGQILPEVQFEIALPTAWNGRLYMFGNGGVGGESFDEPTRRERRDRALSSGFAVAQTNTGHDRGREPEFTFARDPQKLSDYAYRAVHVTVTVAKEVVRTYYGEAPARSYFAGCSTGGRQGLTSAQVFPDDFDGILVGAPVLDVPAINLQIAAAQRSLGAAKFTPAKVRYLSALVQRKCDGLDGVLDDVTEDPRKCSVDFATEVRTCGPGESSEACLTAAERQALDVFTRPLVAGGRRVYPSFPDGTGILAPAPDAAGGSLAFWVGQDRPPISLGYVESFFANVIQVPENADWRQSNLDELERMLHRAQPLIATDPDLSRFHARGGKIILYHGWAEPQLSPLLTIDYVEQVSQTMGGSTDEFLRLFMVPGMLHCRGGVGPDTFDLMTPLVDWVERGVAPQQILARRVDDDVTRTRPLCAYPAVATYVGRGSTDDATNFVCRIPFEP